MISVFFRLNFSRLPWFLLGCLLFLFLWAGSVPAEELTKGARCSWDKPLYGPPVDHYVLELEQILGDKVVGWELLDWITEEFYLVELEFGFQYRCRVAGVDGDGRQGPWSLWTSLYAPEDTVSDHLQE